MKLSPESDDPMAFICPVCGAGELRLVASLELPADSRSDEITVQAAECGACGLLAAAVYEESRRGRLDSEAWFHTGYLLGAEQARELLARIRSCPEPARSACTCPAHAELGATDETGRWLGLSRWGAGTAFPLRWAGL